MGRRSTVLRGPSGYPVRRFKFVTRRGWDEKRECAKEKDVRKHFEDFVRRQPGDMAANSSSSGSIPLSTLTFKLHSVCGQCRITNDKLGADGEDADAAFEAKYKGPGWNAAVKEIMTNVNVDEAVVEVLAAMGSGEILTTPLARIFEDCAGRLEVNLEPRIRLGHKDDNDDHGDHDDARGAVLADVYQAAAKVFKHCLRVPESRLPGLDLGAAASGFCRRHRGPDWGASARDLLSAMVTEAFDAAVHSPALPTMTTKTTTSTGTDVARSAQDLARHRIFDFSDLTRGAEHAIRDSLRRGLAREVRRVYQEYEPVDDSPFCINIEEAVANGLETFVAGRACPRGCREGNEVPLGSFLYATEPDMHGPLRAKRVCIDCAYQTSTAAVDGVDASGSTAADVADVNDEGEKEERLRFAEWTFKYARPDPKLAQLRKEVFAVGGVAMPEYVHDAAARSKLEASYERTFQKSLQVWVNYKWPKDYVRRVELEQERVLHAIRAEQMGRHYGPDAPPQEPPSDDMEGENSQMDALFVGVLE